MTLPSCTAVAVIGAGYAGLSAALSLADAGVDVVVLEGSNRVGGRTLSESRLGVVLDHGGQWVGPTQKELLAWGDRFGCATFPSWDHGDHVDLWADGSLRRYATGRALEAPGTEGYLRATETLDAMAATVPVEDPVSFERLAAWDSETFESWLLREVADPAARRRLAQAVQGVWACEPRDLSLFHLLFYVAAGGGWASLMGTLDAAQDSRFVLGAQAPAAAAAATLGDRVLVQQRVTAVDDTGPAVSLEVAGRRLRADRVVVAVPPPAVAALDVTPALPVSRRGWLAASAMGQVAKVHVAYPTPFWRSLGLSGQVNAFDDGAVGVVFDNSPADAAHGVLVCFVYGDRYRRWAAQPPATRRTAVLDRLTNAFGPTAAEPIDYVEKLWPEDVWAGGGYAAVPAPGAWLEHAGDGWRRPVGRLHWAGTETATAWHGYIDGAIRSGQRAAEEVIAALR